MIPVEWIDRPSEQQVTPHQRHIASIRWPRPTLVSPSPTQAPPSRKNSEINRAVADSSWQRGAIFRQPRVPTSRRASGKIPPLAISVLSYRHTTRALADHTCIQHYYSLSLWLLGRNQSSRRLGSNEAKPRPTRHPAISHLSSTKQQLPRRLTIRSRLAHVCHIKRMRASHEIRSYGSQRGTLNITTRQQRLTMHHGFRRRINSEIAFSNTTRHTESCFCLKRAATQELQQDGAQSSQTTARPDSPRSRQLALGPCVDTTKAPRATILQCIDSLCFNCQGRMLEMERSKKDPSNTRCSRRDAQTFLPLQPSVFASPAPFHSQTKGPAMTYHATRHSANRHDHYRPCGTSRGSLLPPHDLPSHCQRMHASR